MPDNSVAVIFANPVRNFANDVDFPYHQDPDLYYFSGYKEPHAILFIFKEPQKAADGSTYKDLFFVQQRNPRQEQWTGRRLGAAGVKAQLGINMVFDGEMFNRFPIDFSRFNKILLPPPPDDVLDVPKDSTDLFDLIKQFKAKAVAPADIASDKRFDTDQYFELTTALRGIKTEEEMLLLRKAVEISSIAHAETMKAIDPNMSELELQGLQEYVHKKYGAEVVGYPSIVGAGNNGCILHYEENTKTHIGASTVLMDVGAMYHGYSADVTRTVPVSGKFSPEQKAIYNIVYEAQEAVFKLCKEGTSFAEIEKKAREIVTKGLLQLGIIKNENGSFKYYPHGCSHHIGLDVHDRGSYEKLMKNMVITVEPGIYIPEGSDCDKKWWGIAVRIEDDVLINEKDYELLSSAAPRKAEEVEKMVQEKSPIDSFKLPALKSAKKAF